MHNKILDSNLVKPNCLFSLLLTLVFTLSFPKTISAQVVINEFDVFASPQAVELLNISDQAVDISGWYLDDSGGTTYLTIPNQSTLAPHTCTVIRGGLNLNTTTADTVRLFDSTAPPTDLSSRLVDSYTYTQFTTVGNSYSRNPDGNGSFSILPSSPGLTNSGHVDCTAISSTHSPTPISTPTTTPLPSTTTSPTVTSTPTLTLTPTSIFTSTPTPIPHIYISEVMVNPSIGAEWVELYNDSSEPYTMHNWSLDDVISSGSSPVYFSLTIPAHGYVAVDMTSSMFNNTGDSVRLLDSESREIEVFMYTSSQTDISWGRQSFESISFCYQGSSKGISNNSCLLPTSSPSGTSTPTPTSVLSPTPTPISPNNIYLSELYVNTNPGEHEWVELYNDNRYAVQLNNWKVRDASDQIIAIIHMSLDAYRYGVVELTSDKMNNTNEQVFLLNSSGEVVDHFTYSDSEKGISWGRSTSSFSTWCLQNASRNAYNSSCIPQSTLTPTPTGDLTNTPTPTKTRTPTPTTRLSVGSQKSTNSSSDQGGDVLGASTLTLNFTPQYSSDTKDSPASAVSEELPEIPVRTSPSQIPQFLIYFFLTSLCMIGGGFQIAKLWMLYQNFTPAYPDMFG
jgi:hypothetical protein